MDKQALQALRNNYSEAGLSRADLAAQPFAQFDVWFDQALNAGVAEPNAFCLATVDSDNRAWQRSVLMKSCDRRGIVFFTNYTSRKAQHLAQNAAVSALFAWWPLHRQVSVNGTVEKLSAEESAAYFDSRPRASQLGTWASRQSEVLSNRAQLEDRFSQMQARFESQSVPPPPFWGGYRIVPTRFEFWQGRTSRLHDRFVYTPTPANPAEWHINRLSP